MKSLPNIDNHDHVMELLKHLQIAIYATPEYRAGLPVDEFKQLLEPSREKPQFVVQLENGLEFNVLYASFGEDKEPGLHFVVFYKDESQLIVPFPRATLPTIVELIYFFFDFMHQPSLADDLTSLMPVEDWEVVRDLAENPELTAVSMAFAMGLRGDEDEPIATTGPVSDMENLLNRVRDAIRVEEEDYPHIRKTFKHSYIDDIRRILIKHKSDVYLQHNYRAGAPLDEVCQKGKGVFVLEFAKLRFAVLYEELQGEEARLQLLIDNRSDSRSGSAINYLPDYSQTPPLSALTHHIMRLLADNEYMDYLKQVVDLTEEEVRDFRLLGQNAEVVSLIIAIMIIETQSVPKSGRSKLTQ